MAEPRAQLAYFGAIDNAVCNNPKAETLEYVEKLLPGATRPGRRGWYGEMQRYLNKNREAVQPTSIAAETDRGFAPGRSADAEIRFPSLADAVSSVIDPSAAAAALFAPGVLSAPGTAKLLFASTVISGINDIENNPRIFGPGAENLFDKTQDINPLTMLLGRTSNADHNTCANMAGSLINSVNRSEYSQKLHKGATEGMVKLAVAAAAPSCNGVLRKAGGKYFSVLTTDLKYPDITLAQLQATIEPHNWPLLYDFFVRMDSPQPRTANGWIRLLEVVSPDPTQWELRTSLQFWKGETAEGGFCLNYDLDRFRDPRDSGLVEVDSGFIWVSPLNPGQPEEGVRIRTSKALRIRGLSPVATAAIGCYTGWVDAGTHLLTEHVQDPPEGCIPFIPYSPAEDDGGDDADGEVGQTADTLSAPVDPVAAAEAAAEALDLPTGWRESLIENSKVEIEKNIDAFSGLATKTAGLWDGGLDEDDIRTLGTDFGKLLTDRGTGMFSAVMNSMRPAADKVDQEDPQ